MEIKKIEPNTKKPLSGMAMLVLNILLSLVSVGLIILGAVLTSGADTAALGIFLIAAGVILVVVSSILYGGLRVVKPNNALVLTLFGNYYRTIIEPGFYFVVPFAVGLNPERMNIFSAAASSLAETGGKSANNSASSSDSLEKTISLKTRTLDNGVQKVNDVLGNPIDIGAVAIWRVADPTSAVFNVDNFSEFLSVQTDSTVRNIARLYPYDIIDDCTGAEELHSEKTLRGSSVEIAERMTEELQNRVSAAGLTVEEVRITHLAYSEEIAAAMLQRQQAAAVIAARQKIVDGAVSMVKMAIDKLSEDEIVLLDEERKAQMVSNLLVVLCSNKESQPVINSSSIY